MWMCLNTTKTRIFAITVHAQIATLSGRTMKLQKCLVYGQIEVDSLAITFGSGAGLVIALQAL
ncbi:MAG: hypothetical protein C7B45_17270 [Sulfobacillus acidophilus]|uniref:Uncharacterized protein n=1 Tax=Sulfobacillus acidophilus TaxID=53633 RepID=A0A2T2WCK6_9FIRM|nr:MAG: hypothetical protein C7B45_17270 [Sulfobacillus acidophilus]